MNFRFTKFITSLLVALTFLTSGLPTFTTVAIAAVHTSTTQNEALDVCGIGGTGSISGRVTLDAPQAVEDISIGVSATSVYGSNFYRKSAFPDSDGLYTFENVPNGTYYLEAYTYSSKLDYIPYKDTIYNQQPDTPRFTPVQVVNGQETPNINFTLERGTMLTGRVTELGSGKPLSGTVYAYNTETPNYTLGGGKVDENGYYTITHALWAASYKLEFSPLYESYKYQDIFYPNENEFDAAQAIEIPDAEQVTINMAVTLVPDGEDDEEIEWSTITGTITIADSGVFTNSYVVLRVYDVDTGERGGYATYTPGSRRGYYELRIPPGVYKVRAEPTREHIRFPQTEYTPRFYGNSDTFNDAQTITVTANSVISNINISLIRGGQISGRITSSQDASGVEGATVTATNADPNLNGSIHSISTSPDASGYYTFPALPNGVYTVTVKADNEGCQFLNTEYATPVTLSNAQNVPNINVALTPGGFIAGRFTNAETGTILRSGTANALTADQPENTRLHYDTPYYMTGYYLIGPLPPGSYQVRGASFGYTPLFYNNLTDREDAPFFTITGDEIITDINFALKTAPDNPEEPEEPEEPGEPQQPEDGGKLYLPSLRRVE